jgi:hypothetical protein
MRYDRNRTNLDDHAVHSLVPYLTPQDEDERPPGLGPGSELQPVREAATQAEIPTPTE